MSGTISEIGGGKFANGAVTGAFSIMFNDMMHREAPAADNGGDDDVSLAEIGKCCMVGGGALFADDATGIGVLDDPIAAGLVATGAVLVVADYVVEAIPAAYYNMSDALKCASEHTKDARPSTEQKHQKGQARKRDGNGYIKGHNRNQRRGSKNQKHEPSINPNKYGNDCCKK